MNDPARVLLGLVLPMTHAGARAEAIAWRGGRVLAVGDEASVLEAAGPVATVERVSGAVLPGFIDAHHHLSIAAVHRDAVDCHGITRLETLTARLGEAAAALEPGAWIYAVGYDELALDTRRHPPLEALNAALGAHPLCLVHYTCHQAMTNSAGLRAAGIDDHTPDPPGGRIDRDRAGRATGRLVEAAMGYAEAPARRAMLARLGERWFERLARYSASLAQVGITAIADPTVSPELEALYREAVARRAVAQRVVMMPVGAMGYLAPPLDRLDGPPSGEGDARLRIGPMKLFFDGAPACAMCLSFAQSSLVTWRTLGRALSSGSLQPLRTMLSTEARWERGRLRSGVLYHPRERALGLVREVASRGFGVAIHAIGNEAVSDAIDAIAAAPEAGGRRIEHCTFIDHEDVTRLADAGIAIVAQPAFVQLPAYDDLVPLGGIHTLPLRTLLDAGVRVVGSSDAPVTGFDPLDGVRGAVWRRTRSGRAFGAEEALDVEAALALYTREAARLLGLPCGTLAPDQAADLVVLSGDPRRELEGLRVLRTVIDGEVVYVED